MNPVDLGGGAVNTWSFKVEQVVATVGSSAAAPVLSTGEFITVIDVHDLPMEVAANSGGAEFLVGVSYLTDLPYQQADLQWRAQWVASAEPELAIQSSYAIYDQQLQPYLALEADGSRLKAFVALVEAMATPGPSEIEQKYSAVVLEATNSVQSEALIAAWNDTPVEERGLQIGIVPDDLLGRYEAIGLDIRTYRPDLPGLIQVMSAEGVSHSFVLAAVESHVVPALRLPEEVLEIFYVDEKGTRTKIGEASARPGEVAILEVSVEGGSVKVTQSGTRLPNAEEIQAAAALGIGAAGDLTALPDE